MNDPDLAQKIADLLNSYPSIQGHFLPNSVLVRDLLKIIEEDND